MKDWIPFLTAKMDEQLSRLERLRLDEYVAYLEDRRRFLWGQFVGGMVRGLGAAVGFTVLGAMIVWILQDLAQRNLPVIGNFLAQIVDLVQKSLE